MAAPFPSLLLRLFSPPCHVEEGRSKGEGSRAAMQSRAEQVGRQRDDHQQPRSALACHVLLDADAKHTQYHTGPTSLPLRRSLHLLLITTFPFPLSHDATHRNEEGVACRWRRTWAAGDDGDEHEQSGCCCCCCVSSVHWHMHWARQCS